jgi:hypothetical protein
MGPGIHPTGINELSGMRSLAPLVLSSGWGLSSCSTGGSPAATEPHGLPNVFPVTQKLWSGGLPEGDAGFDELESLGIKTIISVDGAAPDVARARARGMRYVHLPVAYHGIGRVEQLALARAVQDLDGPIYLHCHHGMHRGPAAAASAAVVLGSLTPAEGELFLRTAGTAPSYAGLYRCVREAAPADPVALAAAPAAFPEVAQTPGFIKAMAAAQDAYDHLAEIEDAGWMAPPAHPDLVPIDEAGRLENLLRAMTGDPEVAQYPAAFAGALAEATRLAQELEDAIAARAPAARLTARLKAVNDSCKSCHVQYRDTKKLSP